MPGRGLLEQRPGRFQVDTKLSGFGIDFRPPVLYRHHACGKVSSVDLRCAHCGEPMHAGDIDLLPGPGSA